MGIQNSKLNYKDLCCISISCRRLHRLSSEDSLWLLLLSSDFSSPNQLNPYLNNATSASAKSTYKIKFDREKARKVAAHRRAVLRKESEVLEFERKIREIESGLRQETEKMRDTAAELSNLHKARQAYVALNVWQPEVIRGRQKQIVEQSAVPVESRVHSLEMELKLCRQRISSFDKAYSYEKRRLEMAMEQLASLKYHPLRDHKLISHGDKEGNKKRKKLKTSHIYYMASKKTTSGNRLDVGWQHGIDIENTSRKVQCKYCQKIFSGGIYRFKHHLACTRKDVEPCHQVPADVKQMMLNVLVKNLEASEKKRKASLFFRSGEDADEDFEFSSTNKGKKPISGSGSGSTQLTINHMLKKDIREEACQQIARFFYTSAIPFNCARNPEFVKALELVAKHGPGFKPPSYHDIREKYLKQEVDKTMHLLDDYKLEWKKTGCSIMSDGWTDRKRRSICNFLVNSPRGTFFLSSVDTSHISKTAFKVFEMLDAIVERIGEANVVQVITDNAANYKAAGHLLMEKRKTLYWTPCSAHCIDLILEDFEKKLELHALTIGKGRRITTYIYSRSLLISMLRKFTKGQDLIRPGATRFATAYLTLGCLSNCKITLMSMFTSVQWRSSRYSKSEEGRQIQNCVLDSNFWHDVSECIKAAFPLIKVLRLVDSDEIPAMGFIYKAMQEAKEKIKVNFGNVQKRYIPVLDIIDARWELQLHRPLHAFAYWLNPHYHYITDYKQDKNIKYGMYDCLTRMVPDEVERGKIDLQLNIFSEAKGLFGIEAAKKARDKKTPARWWDSYGDECPELQNLAIRVLSLTCSSSGCERNWSAFEMVHTKRRNCLQQKKMNDLVFVMCNLKMNDKDKKQVIDFDDVVDDLPSDDEWVTEGERHGGLSNINLLQTIDSATRRQNGTEDDSDEDNFNGVEMSTEATEDYFETLHSRSLELNNVGTGSTSNLFHCDAIDAILGHSEGGESETEAGFSLHCTPAEDFF